jgi:RNA polymerase primary sigma factor
MIAMPTNPTLTRGLPAKLQSRPSSRGAPRPTPESGALAAGGQSAGRLTQQRTRARRLLAEPIAYVGIEESAPGAIPDRGLSDDAPTPETIKEFQAPFSIESLDTPARGMSPYLASLYRTRLMTPDEESEAFVRMNQWKHQASLLRESLRLVRPSGPLMDQIEGYLRAARELRDQIVRCNLRLVVSIAKKFVQDDWSLDDLVAEGNLALFRSVEKFNVTRGYRFSTYATHAIRRHLYRLVVRRKKETVGKCDDSNRVLGVVADMRQDSPAVEDRVTPAVGIMCRLIKQLDRREQLIVRERYGLASTGQRRTLIDLARHLGVCKERVRQLEIRALRKLRAALAGEQVTELIFDA